MLQFANQDPHPGFALSQRILRATPSANIDEGHDDAVYLVLDSAIRLEPSEIPTPVLPVHLALSCSQIAQNLARVRREVVIVDAMGEVGNGARCQRGSSNSVIAK